MNFRISTVFCSAVLAACVVAAQEKSAEEELQVHRYDFAYTAPWDAFEYMNRLSGKPGKGETPEEFAGRILGNIANVEGRILVKVPPGWERPAYDGFKMFFNTTGEGASANCAACHVAPDFGGETMHEGPSGVAVKTPALRNLNEAAPYFEDESAETLEDVIRAKIELGEAARDAGEAGDPEYKAMVLIEEDIEPLVAFLKQLEPVEKDKFRDLIVNHTILDTSYLF